MSGRQHKPGANSHGHPCNDSTISESRRSSAAQAGSKGKEKSASVAGGDCANSDHAMRNDTSSIPVATRGRTAGTVLGGANIHYAMANTPAPFHGIGPSSSSTASRSGPTAAIPQDSAVNLRQQTGMHLQHCADAASGVNNRPEHPCSPDFSKWNHYPKPWLEEDLLVWLMARADRSGHAPPPINDISAHMLAHDTWPSSAMDMSPNVPVEWFKELTVPERPFSRSPLLCSSHTPAAVRSPSAPQITKNDLLDPPILPAHDWTHDKAPAGMLSAVSPDLSGYNSGALKTESASPFAPAVSRPFNSPAPVVTSGQDYADWRERLADMAARTWNTPTPGVNSFFGKRPLFQHQDAHPAAPVSPSYVPPRPPRLENGGVPPPGIIDPRVVRPPVQRRESLFKIVGNPANNQSRQSLLGGNSARFINGQLRRPLRQVVAEEHARRAEAAAKAEEDDNESGNGGGDRRGRALGSEVLLHGSLPDEEGPFDRQFAR